MKLLAKTKDVQGTRYHYTGAFKFVEEDWEKKNRRKSTLNDSSLKVIIQEIFNTELSKEAI